MKFVKTLRAVYSSGDKPIVTIRLDIGDASEPRLTIIGETTCATQSVSGDMAIREIAKTFARLFSGLALERWPEMKPTASMLAKACSTFAEEAIESTAPDRTFQVRAGCLLPMNRLPQADDPVTLTLSADRIEG